MPGDQCLLHWKLKPHPHIKPISIGAGLEEPVMKVIHHLDVSADGFGELILFLYPSKNAPDPLPVRGVDCGAICDQRRDKGVHCFDFSPERKTFSEVELSKRSRTEDPVLVDKVSVTIETNPLIPPRANRKPAVETIAGLWVEIDKDRAFLLDLQVYTRHDTFNQRFAVHRVSSMFWNVMYATQ